MNQDKVSIIIPTYNFGRYIEQCITSVMRQKYNNLEIIIINDGSTDETKTILDGFSVQNHEIKVINKDNGGVSTARNDGLKIATGKYVIFIDGDDYISEDCVEYLVKLIKHGNSQFAFSKNCFSSKSDLQIANDFIENISSDKATALLLSPRLIVGSWNKIYDRNFLIENDIYFDEDLFYGEGLRFITKVSQKATRIVTGERKVYYYRRNNYSSATSKFNVGKLYNGLLSIQRIKDTLHTNSQEVKDMLTWHETQFHMGIIVRISEAQKKNECQQLYNSSLHKLRKQTFAILFNRGISVYKKLLLVGTSFSPSLMAKLDKIRRKKIAKNSVE